MSHARRRIFFFVALPRQGVLFFRYMYFAALFFLLYRLPTRCGESVFRNFLFRIWRAAAPALATFWSPNLSHCCTYAAISNAPHPPTTPAAVPCPEARLSCRRCRRLPSKWATPARLTTMKITTRLYQLMIIARDTAARNDAARTNGLSSSTVTTQATTPSSRLTYHTVLDLMVLPSSTL